eukprot:Skav236565  [mRNA]  locus=scaffold1066:482436:484876:- [translate_table: standard]
MSAMSILRDEDFEVLIGKLTSAHQNQVSSLQRKVERLQSQLKQSKFRSTSSRVDFDDPCASRPFGGENTEISSAPSVLTVEVRTPKDQAPSHTTNTPTSRKSRFIFGKAAGNISTNEGESEEETSPGCARLLSNPKFEAAICLMIFANAVVFALESQNTGMAFGYNLFGGDYPGRLFWADGDVFFEVLEIGFGIIFTVEVVLRLFVRRLSFFCGMWNWLDLIIVLVWIISKMAVDIMPVNSQVLRLARLIRLFRLLRLVRRIQQFDSLYLMSTAIRSSFGILGWTAALLFLIQMLFALVLNQLLYGFYFSAELMKQEGNEDLKDKFELVYTYFGTFSRALLTMFEITLANWPPVCRALTENVTEWFMIFFLIHKVTMGFAVIGVINGVLMQETFKVASYDDTIMMRTKQKAMQNHIKKMQLLFEEADTSEDGRIDLDEFTQILADSELKAWLGAMELDIRNVGEAWELLQDDCKDRSGGLTAEQLVLGVARLQGTAKSLDLMKVIKEQNSIKEKIDHVDKSLRSLRRSSVSHADLNLMLEKDAPSSTSPCVSV